jgi:hypothetical protein
MMYRKQASALERIYKSQRSPLKQQMVINDFAIMPVARFSDEIKHLLNLSPQESEDKKKDEHGSIVRAKTDTTASSKPSSLLKQGLTNALPQPQSLRFTSQSPIK